jgi:aminoglycoside phosphotransferase (APT) family kinase protein
VAMIVSLDASPSVGTNLLNYLEDRLGLGSLRYAQDPQPTGHGWETYICRFRLQSAATLPAEFSAPLVVRIYSNCQAIPRIEHEFAAQQHMFRRGYPVAEPVLCESDCALFGAPFMIMKETPGRPLLEQLLDEPWHIWNAPFQMAAMQVELHRMPVDGFPRRDGPFLDRHLDDLSARIKTHDLDGLSTAFEWLAAHRPRPVEPPCIVHLDFHPINLMFANAQVNGVLDWGDSDVGDRHADVATSLVLMRSVPAEAPTFWQWLATLPGRGMLYRRYGRGYRRRLPLDRERLGYYIAWAALRRLCRYGSWLRAGSAVAGYKPSALRHLTLREVRVLACCVQEQAHVPVHLDFDPDPSLMGAMGTHLAC